MRMEQVCLNILDAPGAEEWLVVSAQALSSSQGGTSSSGSSSRSVTDLLLLDTVTSGYGHWVPDRTQCLLVLASPLPCSSAGTTGSLDGGVKRLSGGALHASAARWPLQVLRSSQLDAERLDHELVSMLHEQFMKVFAHCQQVGSGVSRIRWKEGMLSSGLLGSGVSRTGQKEGMLSSRLGGQQDRASGRPAEQTERSR